VEKRPVGYVRQAPSPIPRGRRGFSEESKNSRPVVDMMIIPQANFLALVFSFPKSVPPCPDPSNGLDRSCVATIYPVLDKPRNSEALGTMPPYQRRYVRSYLRFPLQFATAVGRSACSMALTASKGVELVLSRHPCRAGSRICNGVERTNIDSMVIVLAC
jgi:hypothetical protein